MKADQNVDLFLNQMEELGFDNSRLVEKHIPRDDYKLFDYKYEFDSKVQAFGKCRLEIEIGADKLKPDAAFLVHNMWVKVFTCEDHHNKDEELFALYFHRHKGIPVLNTIVEELQRILRGKEIKYLEQKNVRSPVTTSVCHRK